MIAQELRDAIVRYEPRILADSLHIVRDTSAAEDDLKIRFIVRGDMDCDPAPAPVEFVAQLEVASGSWRLARGSAVHPELLDLYNRELALLYEHAQEFAKTYPGVAKQLGDLTRERTDPMLVGLLEGTALLAARVQLKLKDEFAEFTNNLIEQLYPNFLAPQPSVFLARVSRNSATRACVKDARLLAALRLIQSTSRARTRAFHASSPCAAT